MIPERIGPIKGDEVIQTWKGSLCLGLEIIPFIGDEVLCCV